MNYKNEHKDIPGNPSAVKTSSYKLNDRINNSRLNVLSENLLMHIISPKGFFTSFNLLREKKFNSL